MCVSLRMGYDDTIYALSSGAGRAGVAVVRVSGDGARATIRRLCGSVPSPRRFSARVLRSVGGEIMDQGVVVWLPGPGTVTGEDMAEFHVHGSEAVLQRLFQEFGQIPGIRMAEPGEFTRRAFVKGRIDLVEAEGLAALLAARTDSQRAAAVRQMSGSASSAIEDWRRDLIEVLAGVDAVLEFSEESDLIGAGKPPWRFQVRGLVSEMEEAASASRRAQVLRQGVRVVLAGAPNVGKSSVLNALARREAAIVTATPGTTRDIVEVQMTLDGIPFIMMDTAGLRERTMDEIEVIGMARTMEVARDADIVVWLWCKDLAGSETVEDGLRADVIIETKCDLAGPGSLTVGPRLSARTGEGMAEFVGLLTERGRLAVSGFESAVVSEARQIAALRDSIRFLNDALSRTNGELELVSADVRGAANALGRITGRVSVEEWLDAIFCRFCIGK